MDEFGDDLREAQQENAAGAAEDEESDDGLNEESDGELGEESDEESDEESNEESDKSCATRFRTFKPGRRVSCTSRAPCSVPATLSRHEHP